jgi:hypothetical protein
MPGATLLIPARTLQILWGVDRANLHLLSREPSRRCVPQSVGTCHAHSFTESSSTNVGQILFVWILDTLHTAFLAACLYIVVVLDIANLATGGVNVNAQW